LLKCFAPKKKVISKYRKIKYWSRRLTNLGFNRNHRANFFVKADNRFEKIFILFFEPIDEEGNFKNNSHSQ